MVTLYLAFNPWTLKSMEMPGPARRLRQATLASGGFYSFHRFTITYLQRLISKFVLMDEAIVFSSTKAHPVDKKNYFTFFKKETPKPFRLTTYLNVDAFETTFLLAQGYTTLSLFLSFLLSGKAVLVVVNPTFLNQNVTSPTFLLTWFILSFLCAALYYSVVIDNSKHSDKLGASLLNSFIGEANQFSLIIIFFGLFFYGAALNQFNPVWLSISLAGIVLYSCSRGVSYSVTFVSLICQIVVFFTAGSPIVGLLTAAFLFAAQYKFARAHGLGPRLPTVQTRSFSWVYFLSLHMAAPIFTFVKSGPVGPYYLILLVFLFLPVINAIMDWLSMAITRYLMEETIVRARAIRTLLFYLLVDAAVALFLLLVMFFLILTLFVHINEIQKGYENAFSIPIIPLLETLNDDPFAPEVRWLTFMLAMTVVPTLLHYLIVWFSIGIWTAGRVIATIDKRFSLRLWLDEVSGEVNWDKLQAAASLHTAMLLTIIWFVGAGLWIAILLLELMFRTEILTLWHLLIEAAKRYCAWLSG